ncbi:MAG: M56 family metallopeptidase [Candidatus Hydrogenedentes bacterium]|nr:M56 family metallopeptidase [Candidatus Hydrogenedentota bacterium]
MYWWILQHLVIVTVLATIVYASSRAFRLSPAVRHALWVVVLIKLMMPPVIVWPWAMPQFAALNAASPSATTVVDVSEIALESDGAAVPAERVTPVANTSRGATTISIYDTALRWVSTNHQLLLLGLWCAGSVIAAGVHFSRIARYRRYVATRQDVPQWIVDETRTIADRLGVSMPEVYAVKGLHSPLVHHFGRAVLLIPQALLELIPRERWQCILAHELAHLRRGDHVVRWLELFAAIAWWWNPVFWLVQRHLHEAAEEACDAYVVWALPNSRRAYAETLIDVSELISRGEAHVTALGIRNGVRMDFERRLEQILHGNAVPRIGFSALVALALVLGLSLPAWTQNEAATAPAPEATAQAPAAGQPAPPAAISQETTQPTATDNKTTEKSSIEVALDSSVNIEFQDASVFDITDFIADYVGVNIVVDSRYVESPKRQMRPAAPVAPGVQGGTPTAEIAPPAQAPVYISASKYVTDGMVPYIKVEDIPLKNALKALLEPLELGYEVHPGFIWITAKTQLGKDDFSTPAPTDPELSTALEQPASIEFQDSHIADIAEFLSESLGMNFVIDKRAVRASLLTSPPASLQPGAPAGGAPGQPFIPPLTPPAFIKEGDTIVNTGYIAYIKVDDVPACEALKALLVPLNLYYKLGPGFVFISTPELLKTTEFNTREPEPKSATEGNI